MLEKLKQFFFNPVCFRCGSFFVEEHLFCETCFENVITPLLELKERVFEVAGQTIKHYYLIEWIPGESDLISDMIYQIKRDRAELALRFYSRMIAQQFLLQNGRVILQNCVLPLPGSGPQSVHSEIIGRQIGADFKLISKAVFHKTKSGYQQKRQTKKQRGQLEVQVRLECLHELITEAKTDKLSPIYVDDVLTTGGTVKASMSALGLENFGCVMTLFFRPPTSIQFPNR